MVLGTTVVVGLVASALAYLGKDLLEGRLRGPTRAPECRALLAVPLLLTISLYVPLMYLLGGTVFTTGVAATDRTARRALGGTLAGARATVGRVVAP